MQGTSSIGALRHPSSIGGLVARKLKASWLLSSSLFLVAFTSNGRGVRVLRAGLKLSCRFNRDGDVNGLM